MHKSFATKAILICTIILLLTGITIPLFYTFAHANENVHMKEPKNPENIKWGYIAAAIATGMSTIGAAIAVGLVGSSAMGALSEKPEMAGKALIFVGLAEGIAIYGLIVSIMILGML